MGELYHWINNGWTEKTELHRHVIVTNRFDLEDMSHVLDEVASFASARDNLGEFTPTGLEAAQDAWMSFFKGMPLPREASEMTPETVINHRVLEEMRKLPEHERLRRFTVGDDVQAALAFEQIEPDLETLFDRLHKDQQKAQALQDLLNQLAQARQEKHDIDEMVERWKAEHPQPEEEEEDAQPEEDGDNEEGDDEEGDEEGAGGAGDDENGDTGGDAAEGLPEALQGQQNEANQNIEDLERQIEEISQELEDSLERVGSEARHVLRDAIGRAADEAEGFQQAALAWGMEPGELHRLPADERLELAKRLNTPYFRRIADLFGPMKNLMFTEQTRKVEYANEEVFDVAVGNDLSRLLPSELVNLETNEDEFLRRYSERKMLQYEMQGEERLARGGIIFCEDGSYSMEGEREMWAKAVMLCLLHLARQQNRPFHLIHFGSRGMAKLISFENDRDYSLSSILDAAELFYRSGTDFQTPMEIALGLVREQYARNGAVKSDVVFATDDECRVDPKFMDEYLKEAKRLQFTTYGFAITTSPPNPEGALAQMSERKVFHIRDVLSGKEIKEVFRAL